MIIKTKDIPASKQGFTLIEMLLVIALIAIIAAIVFVAVNPARRLAEANNAQRWSDTRAILDAVLTYSVDNDGNLPSGIDTNYTSSQMLGNGSSCSSCASASVVSGCLNIASDLVDNGYIASIPIDPVVGIDAATGYYINQESSGIITVGACEPDAEGESTPTIKVQR